MLRSTTGDTTEEHYQSLEEILDEEKVRVQRVESERDSESPMLGVIRAVTPFIPATLLLSLTVSNFRVWPAFDRRVVEGDASLLKNTSGSPATGMLPASPCAPSLDTPGHCGQETGTLGCQAALCTG